MSKVNISPEVAPIREKIIEALDLFGGKVDVAYVIEAMTSTLSSVVGNMGNVYFAPECFDKLQCDIQDVILKTIDHHKDPEIHGEK